MTILIIAVLLIRSCVPTRDCTPDQVNHQCHWVALVGLRRRFQTVKHRRTMLRMQHVLRLMIVHSQPSRQNRQSQVCPVLFVHWRLVKSHGDVSHKDQLWQAPVYIGLTRVCNLMMSSRYIVGMRTRMWHALVFPQAMMLFAHCGTSLANVVMTPRLPRSCTVGPPCPVSHIWAWHILTIRRCAFRAQAEPKVSTIKWHSIFHWRTRMRLSKLGSPFRHTWNICIRGASISLRRGSSILSGIRYVSVPEESWFFLT